MKAKDITGQKFGRLTAIKFHHRNKKFLTHFWLVRCECGNEKVVSKTELTTGGTKSCGCLINEITAKVNTTHGFCKNYSKEKIYAIWQWMKARCLNKNVKKYKNYGGRGIKICDKWLDFNGFKEDMYNSYLEHIKQYGEKQTSIDRINVNGNYEKDNCRWVTLKEQSQNKKDTIRLTLNNKTLTLKQWSKLLKVNYQTLLDRFHLGWDVDKILSLKDYRFNGNMEISLNEF